MKIALVADAAHPDLIEDDRPLADALRARGAEVEIADWRGDFAALARADFVLVRTPWDYTQYPEEFARWLDRLEAQRVRVANDAPLMRWNMNKRYLCDLAAAGAPLPPTALAAAEPRAVAEAAAALGLERFIVKPAIGASGEGLSLVRAGDAAGIAAALGPLSGDVLVQALAPEIRDYGETSFVFFDGRHSHAALKRAAAGEIRCQAEWGGSLAIIDPPAWAVAEAARMLHYVPPDLRASAAPPLYARIDAIVTEDRFILMEIELIEPELFFSRAAGAADRFADLIVARLAAGEEAFAK